MDRQRARDVRAAINAHAQAENQPVTLRHVCLACADALKASGVAVMLVSTLAPLEPVYAGDQLAEQLSELEITLGEGPATESVREDRPVLVPDVSSSGAAHRWPMYCPEAETLGARAVFSFPLMVGAIAVGVLQVSRTSPGWLSSDDLANALLFADAALLVSLEVRPGDGADLRWAEVHQATGMISVQLDTDLAQAFVRLRAHAYTHDRRLADVARDVIARRLRFTPDSHTT